MTEYISIVGSRIRLRHITATYRDAYLVTAWRNTPEARRSHFDRSVCTPDTHLAFMRNREAHDLVYVVENAETKLPLGMVSLTIDPEQYRGEFGRIFIDSGVRNGGYAEEVIYTILWLAFEFFRLHNLWLDVYITNAAAIKLYHKTGWQDAGSNLPGHTDPNGDVIHMTYTAQLWMQNRQRFMERFELELGEWGPVDD